MRCVLIAVACQKLSASQKTAATHARQEATKMGTILVAEHTLDNLVQ